MGDMFLKNLKIVAHTHGSNLFLVGSQFISRHSLTPTWSLLLSFRQNLMHLFWQIWIFFHKTFAEVRIPQGACIMERWLYQRIA